MKMKIKDIISKRYNYNTTYQRDKAWSPKNCNSLIDSIMNNFYIPPILINENEVVDGKQRILAIESFLDNQFAWSDLWNQSKKRLKYKDFSDQNRIAFDNHELEIIDIGINDVNKLTENFLRININSIKLNKMELSMATAPDIVRKKLLYISSIEEFTNLSNAKFKDKRFTRSGLLTWILSMIYVDNFKTKGIRNIQKVILREKFLEEEFANGLDERLIKTFKILNEIFENDTFSIKSFITVFSSVFVAFYNKLSSFQSFINNKSEIKQKVFNLQKILSLDQMGGGIKFDSWDHIKPRVESVENILSKYENDKNRAFSYEDKLDAWNNSSKICSYCNEKIDNINDAEADHITPYSQGGRTNKTNIQLLHISCNRKKSNKIM